MASTLHPTTVGTFLQEFIDKITLVPNDVNRFIRLIRFLDIRAEKLQKTLTKQQKEMLQKVSQLKDKDKKLLSTAMQIALKQNPDFNSYTVKKLPCPNNLPLPLQQIFNQYTNILNMQKKLLGYSKQKTSIGSQLTAQIRQYFQVLQKQVRSKILKQLRPQQLSGLQQLHIQQLIIHLKKRKQQSSISTSTLLANKKRQDFYYDPKQDKFCYCGQASYGDMVFCQNLYCQRQWFHLNCIKESNLPERWFCNECQKMKDKTKNPVSRTYFSIS